MFRARMSAIRSLSRRRRRLELSARHDLEARTLLASSTLDIVNGILTYTASAGVDNHLTVKVTALTTSPGSPASQNQYTFSDTGESITLGPGAVTAGWTGSGTGAVSGIDTGIKGVSILTLDGNDSVNIQAVNEPTTIQFSSNPGALDSVVIGQTSKGATNIAGDISIVNQQGATALTLSDLGDTSPKSPLISSGTVLDYPTHPVDFSQANVSSIAIVGGVTLNINANKEGPVSVAPGGSPGAGSIAVGSEPVITYSDFVAVNISNAADQGLTLINQAVATTTGDTPYEGKAYPYQVAGFTDADPFSKPGNFVASVNWGDGTTTPGAISTSGMGSYIVTGSHTYEEAGPETVTTTITDTGDSGTTEIGGIPVTVSDLGGGVAVSGTFAVGQLVSNGPFSPFHVDPNLVNSWGLAQGPGTSLGVANAGTSTVTFYDGTGALAPALGVTPSPSVIAIPGPAGIGVGSPTGLAYNPTTGYVASGAPSTFLIATLQGAIEGWNSAAGTRARVLAHTTGDVYTGLALAQNGAATDLYVANFITGGKVEVYSSTLASLGTFTDPALPAGYAPFNIATINGNLYVSFAKVGTTPGTPVAGLGLGYVDVFSPAGTLLSELIAGAPLNAPYGMALAPSTYPSFGGDLLVGNTGDGTINAFDPATGAPLGTIENVSSQVIAIAGLKGLLFGSGVPGQDPNSLYFASGPLQATAGLFGTVAFAPGQDQATHSTLNSVTIPDAPITATVTAIKAIEGIPITDVPIGTITDTNPFATTADFTTGGGNIVVNWGDGKPTNSVNDGSGTVTISQLNGPGSAFIIFGTHTFDEDNANGNPYPVTITVTDDEGATATPQGAATVADADINATAFNLAFVEGATIPAGTVVGTFQDLNPTFSIADYQSPTIDLGGGTTKMLASIVPTAVAGVFDFVTTIPVAYAHAGVFESTVSVSDVGGKKASANGVIAVAQAPWVLLVPVLTATEGKSFSGDVATFTENPLSKPGNFIATIAWGDGAVTTGTVKEDASGLYHVSGTHTYAADGTFILFAVAVTDTDIPTAPVTLTVGSTAVVADAALKATIATPTLTEGAAFAGKIASFTDANPLAAISDYAATITWSDGFVQVTTAAGGGITPDPAGPAGFIVIAAHPAFADEGSISFAVVIADVFGTATATVSGTAKIGPDNTLKASSPAAAIAPTEGQQLPLLPAGVTVATFTDSADANANAADYTATVDWGDGTGTDIGLILPGANGSFNVVDTHLYAEAGTFSLKVTVSDDKGAETSAATTSVTVKDAALTNVPLGVIKGVAGRPMVNQFVATFSDGYIKAPVSDYSGTIDWGDGSLVTAAVFAKGNNGDFVDVIGTHTYAREGKYILTINITDIDGSTLTIDPPEIDIADAPLEAVPAPVVATEGDSFTETVATFHDSDPSATASDFTSGGGSITIDWGDGAVDTVAAGDLTVVSGAASGFPSSGVTFEVTGTHTYNDDDTGAEIENYQVKVTILDQGGSTAKVVSQASVSDPILTDPGIGVNAVAGVTFQGPVSTFSSSDQSATAGQFHASIVWGDGSSTPGAIAALGGGKFEVIGTHAFAAPGSYAMTVTVQDSEGHVVQDSTTATVTGTASVTTKPTFALRRFKHQHKRHGVAPHDHKRHRHPVPHVAAARPAQASAANASMFTLGTVSKPGVAPSPGPFGGGVIALLSRGGRRRS